jgi:striatin 1/3/4
MLEYALKQERAKYLKSAGQNVSASALSAVGESGQAQSGSAPADALSQAQQQAPHSLKDKYSTLNLSTTKRNTSSKTRELLKQYLQEVGYSDSLSSVPGGEWRFNSLRFNSSSSKGSGAASSGKYNTINFNEGQAPMLMLSAKQQQQQQANEEKNALKNMFVPALKSTDDNDLSSDFTSSSVTSDSTPAAPSVNVKKEAPSEGTKSAWENMFSSGNGMEGSETVILPPKMMKQMEASSKKNNRRTVIGPGASMNGGSFGSNSAVLSGELADLSVESNTTAASADLVSKSDSAASAADLAPRSWKPKLTLKSHLDSVTNVAFHPNDLSLITCGEDSMIKYWSLESYGAMKKPPMDIEPIYTYRGHSGPVYSCLISETVPENFSTERYA